MTRRVPFFIIIKRRAPPGHKSWNCVELPQEFHLQTGHKPVTHESQMVTKWVPRAKLLPNGSQILELRGASPRTCSSGMLTKMVKRNKMGPNCKTVVKPGTPQGLHGTTHPHPHAESLHTCPATNPGIAWSFSPEHHLRSDHTSVTNESHMATWQALVAPQVPRFRGLEWIQALRVNGVTEDHVDLAKMSCCAKKAVGGDKDRYRQMRTSHEPDDLGKLFDPP